MRTLLGIALAGALAACSGYGGGGDARIAPVSDAGTASGSSPRPSPSGSSSTGPDEPPPEENLVRSLVAYYPFDGDLSDLSGSGFHLDANSPISYGSGRVGSALEVTQHSRPLVSTQATGTPLTLPGGELSIQVWIRAEEGTLLLGVRSGGDPTWMVTAQPYQIRFGAFSPYGSGAVASSVSASPDPRHVVVRRTVSGATELFVDGEHLATGNVAIDGHDGTFVLEAVTGGDFLRGSFDELALWSRALTDDEIQELYNGGSGRSLAP